MDVSKFMETFRDSLFNDDDFKNLDSYKCEAKKVYKILLQLHIANEQIPREYRKHPKRVIAEFTISYGKNISQGDPHRFVKIRIFGMLKVLDTKWDEAEMQLKNSCK